MNWFIFPQNRAFTKWKHKKVSCLFRGIGRGVILPRPVSYFHASSKMTGEDPRKRQGSSLRVEDYLKGEEEERGAAGRWRWSGWCIGEELNDGRRCRALWGIWEEVNEGIHQRLYSYPLTTAAKEHGETVIRGCHLPGKSIRWDSIEMKKKLLEYSANLLQLRPPKSHKMAANQ